MFSQKLQTGLRLSSQTRLNQINRASRMFSSSNMTLKQTIGFIGLGQMGNRMALNLVNKTDRTTNEILVYDTNPESCKNVVENGAIQSSSIVDMAKASDIIITMLPATPHVEQTLTTHIFPHLKEGSLIIDSSTIDPVVSMELNKKANDLKLQMVDAPVSGGVGGAEAGTLTFMCGASNEEAFNLAKKEALVHMGKNIMNCGGPGMGGVAKVCNNLVLGINMVGTCEAMSLGVKLGIDPKVLSDILNTSSGKSWVSELYNPVPGVNPNVPSSNGYEGGFASALMMKDLFLAAQAAKAVKAPLPLGAGAHAMYEILNSQGLGGKDFGVVYKFLQGKEHKGKP